MSTQQPGSVSRPLTGLETDWIARNRLALARLYEACLADEEIEDETQNGTPDSLQAVGVPSETLEVLSNGSTTNKV